MDLSSEKIKSNCKFGKQRTQERKAAAALLRHKYTTRQIMEIMELRRRQMGLATEDEPDHRELSQTAQEIHSEVVEAKAPVSVEEPERIWEPPVGNVELKRPQENRMVPVAREQEPVTQAPMTVEAYEEPWHVKPASHLRAMMDYLGKAVRDGVLTAGAFMLFCVMLTYILGAGASADYDQGPFLFLAVLLTMWFNRRRLHKGERSLWLGVVSMISGIVMFACGVLYSQVYVALGGFILTAAGIFCGRHTKQTANRLFFPLLCLVFVIAPPAFLMDALAPTLNAWVAHGSAFLLRVVHIPVAWQGDAVDMGGYQFFVNRDTAVFRTLVAALPLAALYTHYRFKRNRYRRTMVWLAVLPAVLLGGIVHAAVTGWIAYTYGNPYADAFYGLGASVMLFILGLSAFVDSLIAEDEVL
jgi:hypothetical protein